ncbi:MAG: DUF4433 domain-containing protein [Paraburkholderia sp.]|nr:MAG: DUF4433 domain-containing protein [Paraburkholderia sp.]
MPRLKSGRTVGISFEPYMRLLRSPPGGRHYGTDIHFRLHVHRPMDFLQFASVLEYDQNGPFPPDGMAIRSDYLVSDLALGKSDWLEDEVDEFDAWISSKADLGSWLKNCFDEATLVTRPKHVFRTFSDEGYRELKSHSDAVDRLFSLYPIVSFFHFTDIRNIPIIKAARGIFSTNVIAAAQIPIATLGGDSNSQLSDKRKGMDKYVHLCMFDQHPMEYRARQDGRILQSRFLEIDREVLREKPDIRFTSIMANTNGARLLTLGEAMDQLDFEVVCTRMDLSDATQMQRVLAARKYELLVPHSVADKYIRNL